MCKCARDWGYGFCALVSLLFGSFALGGFIVSVRIVLTISLGLTSDLGILLVVGCDLYFGSAIWMRC